MSAEALILIALFTLLPLAEQAWKKWQAKREADARRSAPGRPERPRVAAPGPPPLPRTPPGHMPLPLPGAAGHDEDEEADEEVMVAAEPPVQRPVLPPPLPRPARPSRPVPASRTGAAAARRPTVAAAAPLRRDSWREALKHDDELRRGVVLLTVLGPCRAQHPYDGTPR